MDLSNVLRPDAKSRRDNRNRPIDFESDSVYPGQREDQQYFTADIRHSAQTPRLMRRIDFGCTFSDLTVLTVLDSSRTSRLTIAVVGAFGDVVPSFKRVHYSADSNNRMSNACSSITFNGYTMKSVNHAGAQTRRRSQYLRVRTARR